MTSDNSAVQPVTSSSSVAVDDPDSDLVLSAGNYGFQFDYTLPRDVPSSFEGRWGSVKYSVSATLKRPDRFDIERDAQLTVNAYVDLNDDSATDLAVSRRSPSIHYRPRGPCVCSTVFNSVSTLCFKKWHPFYFNNN